MTSPAERMAEQERRRKEAEAKTAADVREKENAKRKSEEDVWLEEIEAKKAREPSIADMLADIRRTIADDDA